MNKTKLILTWMAFLALIPVTGHTEILAMVNYESKPETPRREGIAIMDVDPASKNFGKILNDIPLPGDLVAHHIFTTKTLAKPILLL